MAVPVAAQVLLATSWTLVPAPATSNSLGIGALITTDGLNSARYMTFTTVEAIDAAETATYISSDTAMRLQAMLGQGKRPGTVAVVKYDPTSPSPNEAPWDGMLAALEAGLNVGVFSLVSATESVQETLATSFLASAWADRMLMVVQSADTGLYGGSKPASLDACENDRIRVVYSDDAQPTAAAIIGMLCGKDMLLGPAPARVQLLDCTVPSLTITQRDNILANDASVLQNLDYGASADERILLGETGYAGKSWSAAATLTYINRQCRALLLAWIMEKAAADEIIPANQAGGSLAIAQVSPLFAALASVGHFTPVSTSPDGYLLSASIVSTDAGQVVTLTGTVWIAREAHSFAVAVTGREV